jgi:hypothetical protein
MRRLTFYSSLALLLAVVVSYSSLDSAMTERARFAPYPDSVHQVGGTFMTEDQILLTRIHPRDSTSFVAYQLLRRRNLWPFQYVVAGLAGACAAIWLLLVAGKRSTDWDKVPPSVLLSGLAGLIAYLLVKLATRIAWAESPATYETWLLFPLLAGAFNTVFYNALPGVLTKMIDFFTRFLKDEKKATVLIGWFVFAASTATARAEAQASREAKSAVGGTLYQCIEPKTCSCWAFSDAEKAACPECTKWKATSLSASLSEAIQKLGTGDYKNKAGQFIYDATVNLSTDDHPRISQGSIASLYADPERYGYKAVEKSAVGPGGIVLFPTFGGVVINDSGAFVYPSGRRDGKLRVVDVEAFKASGEVKYLMAVPARAASKKP